MTGIPYILICAIFFFVLSIVGYTGMKRAGTYESIWGFLYIYGLLALIWCVGVAIFKFFTS